MNLDFLGSDSSTPPEKVSTGKTERVSYDTTKADLSYREQFMDECPFLKRAIDNANEIGYNIVDTLQEALTRRSNNEKVLTLHEADIALRNVPLLHSKFLMLAVYQDLNVITEDDSVFSNEVFQLRARYNKGLMWYKDTFPTSTPEQKEKGMLRLRVIRELLVDLKLPPHHEEVEAGFHKEFLKPEWMNWPQFNIVMAAITRNDSIERRQVRQEREQQVIERLQCVAH